MFNILIFFLIYGQIIYKSTALTLEIYIYGVFYHLTSKTLKMGLDCTECFWLFFHVYFQNDIKKTWNLELKKKSSRM